MRQAARAYFETQVTTTSQGQVLIMLYDGAIKFLNLAKERIDAKDFAGKGKLISSAIDVINELANSLNAEKGGDLASNLNQLYFYCNKRLFMANARMNKGPIDEVIKILSGIRSAYAQIIDSPEAVAAMAQAGPVATAKGPRAPLGTPTGPAGPPVSAAKARNAYATQSAAASSTPVQENQPQAAVRPEAEPVPAPDAIGDIPQAISGREPELPVAEAKAAVPLPDLPGVSGSGMPDLDSGTPPPSLAPGKRMAASNLYRKFAS